MIFFSVLTAVFLFLMLAPVFIGQFSRDKERNNALFIRDNNIRDPRYFAHSFLALMERGLKNRGEDGMLRLSRPERLIEVEGAVPRRDEAYRDIVYAGKSDLFVEEGCTFEKEILADGNAMIAPKCAIRAIACRGRLTIGEEVRVARWADAEEGLQAMPGCDLGISATSGGKVALGTNTAFRRLYAPVVETGDGCSAERLALSRLYHEVYAEVVRNPGESEIEERTELAATVITRKNLLIGKESLVLGDIKSRKNVRIGQNAIVTGNVFADGDVVLEEGAQVYGHVFSQEDVLVGPNCSVGRNGRIKSLVVRGAIWLCERSTVYGYVSCERSGSVVSEEEFMSLASERY